MKKIVCLAILFAFCFLPILSSAQNQVVVIPLGGAKNYMYWQGEWTDATAYKVGDAVQMDGSSYIAIAAHTSSFAVNNPPLDLGQYWDALCLKGDVGTCSCGITVEEYQALLAQVTTLELQVINNVSYGSVFAEVAAAGYTGTATEMVVDSYATATDKGYTGTEEQWDAAQTTATTTAVAAAPPVESCAVCHKDVKAIHTNTSAEVITADATVSNVVLTPVGDNLEITFNVKVKGVDSDAFASLNRAYVYTEDPSLSGRTLTEIERSNNMQVNMISTTAVTPATIAYEGAGNYTITVPANSGEATPVQFVYPDAAYYFRLDDGAAYANNVRPSVVVETGTPPLRDLVDQNGCASCHGDYVYRSSHHLIESQNCQICHVRDGRAFSLNSKADGEFATSTGDGGNLAIYVHGIHNSHNMPDGIFYRNTTGSEFSIGYPSDMRNCSTCHSTTAQLEAAVTAPVSFYLCMSCHQSWDGFVHSHAGATYAAGDPIFAPDNFHRTLVIDTNCMSCHNAMPNANEAGDFHTDMQSTDAHYNSLYRGVDISFTNPDNVSFAITGVTVSGSDVTFTWTAEMSGAPVDPCNDAVAAGPVFSAVGAYLAYAKGDDWVNELIGAAPGQPVGARNVFTSLATTCAANEATTTGLLLNSDAATYATKALLTLGGKPKAWSATAGDAYFVRVPSPTYAFNPADGSAATPRRDIVDSTKCTGCHQGTMYQHGGDRIDNVQMCVICHNPASSDKNNRLTRYQIVNADGTVNTDATYDGRTSESYDMRNLLHAIHSVGSPVNQADPFVIYRSRGIYAFVNAATAEPTGWPADGITIYGSTNGSTIAHNWTVIHYPKPVADCEACHNPGTYDAADQTKAVAFTDDAGTNWPYQSDDIVIGPTAAACTSCHDSAPVRSHAQGFGYRTVVTKDVMLEKAK